MTACPHAVWDPLGPQTAHRMDAHDIVCLHTMAGSFPVVHDMFHRDGYGGTESHFGVRGDGYAEQWQDLDFRADANYEGNRRIISIETADMGPWSPSPGSPSFPKWAGSDVPAWTEAQLDKIVALVSWCCDRYDIPKQLVANSDRGRRGIAYHRQGIDGNFGAPYPGRQGVGERWSTGDGKVCPGDRRIRQLIEIVIPRVRGEEDDVDETTFKKWTREVLNEGTGTGQSTWAGTSKATLAGVQGNTNRLNSLAGQVADIDVTIDGMRSLTDADLDAVAKAVNDEQHRRSAG